VTSPDISPEMQELLGKLAFIQLWAIFMKPTDLFQSPQTPEGSVLMVEHLRYLFTLQDQRRLVAAGPLDMNLGSIEGIAIVQAGSRAEAEAIAAEEPFGKAGWRTNTVREWQLNEGVIIDAVRANSADGPTL
jgi:uncharacterized protein YciI